MEQENKNGLLFETPEHFKSIVHNINGYIYTVLYSEGKVIASYHSPKCLDITGYSPQEYNSDPELWISMVHPKDRDFIFDFFSTRTGKTEQKSVEHRIIHKDGSERWISNTFTEQFDENGLILRRDGFIVDITDRKKIELKLVEQYSLLQNIIDSIPNPVFFKNTEGIYVGCNKAFEEYLGMKRYEIVGKTVSDIMGKEFASISSEIDQELLLNGGHKIYESDFLHADGTLRNIIFNKGVYEDADGIKTGIVGVMIDTTELKDIEKRLKTTYDELRELELIVSKSPAVVFLRTATEELSVEFVSANISQFGYLPEEFSDNKITYSDLIHPNDRETVLNEFQKAAQTNKSEFALEYRIVHKSGKVIWVDDHSWMRYSADGKLTHFQGIVIDISKRIQAVQLWRESIERYRTLAENSYDLISEIGPEGKFLYLSPNFFDVLGYQPKELLNRPLVKIVHLDDLPAVHAAIRQDKGQLIHRFKHKNGDWLWFESTGKKYITASGEARGVIVSRDITIRKKLEMQLIRTEKLVAIGEMSAMIAHEFRNSLTSIKMILQLQKESPKIPVKYKKSTGVALKSIYHMESVIRQLLNFAQPAAINFSIEDVNHLVEECMQFLEMQAQKKAIRITKFYDRNIPQMLLHASTLKECIINIMLNATQAFDSSTVKINRRISVRTSLIKLTKDLRDLDLSVKNEYFRAPNGSQSESEIVIPKGSWCALIRIIDNGNGIPEEYQKHIFEPFFTTKEKGSGLGLSIAKRTVNAHGGIITLTSKPQKGTAFSIYLPIGEMPQ